MAKFCKYCGKELKKGEKCDCEKSILKSEKVNHSELEQAKETIKKEVTNSSIQYFHKAGKTIQGVFKNFNEEMKRFIDASDSILTFLVLGCSALILAFCSVSFLKGIYASVNQAMTSISSYYNYSNSLSVQEILHFSYFKILCCIFIGLIFVYLLIATIYYLGFEKISQNHISFRKTLSVIAVSIIEPTLVCIGCVFLTVFSYKLAILFLLYAIVLFVINLYSGFFYATKTVSQSYNRLFVFLFLIFLFLSVYLLPNLFF